MQKPLPQIHPNLNTMKTRKKTQNPSEKLIVAMAATQAKIPAHIQKDLIKVVGSVGMLELLLFLKDYSLAQSEQWRDNGDNAKANAWLELAKELDI